MGIPIVEVMVVECEGVQRGIETGAGCLVCGVWCYVVVRARALRLEVRCERLLPRHGTWWRAYIHVRCNRSSHFLSTGLGG
jgi:hypothetical protein